MKSRVLVLIGAISLTGCTTVHPLIEVEHKSHAGQHIRGKRDGDPSCFGRCGFNAISGGIRWRPAHFPGLTIDVLEGYTKDDLNGQKEIFTGRITWEPGARQ